MSLSERLLNWYKKNGRTLPWRQTRDPYRIVVSELMLQQTQVSRGLVFYPRWLARFPDWKSLSEATNADVIEAWAGLGYNRRALMLRDMAKTIVAEGVPKSAEDWLTLKGVGPYTSAAIACFSLGERVLPIDTNIRRVLGRSLLGKPFPEPTDDEAVHQASTSLLKAKDFHDVPQALFDLATIVCTKTPQCEICPLKEICPCAIGFMNGEYQTPKRTIKKANETKHRNKPNPDRIYRGRILKYIREERDVRSLELVGATIDPDFDTAQDQAWLEAMVERLVKDGLIEKKDGRWQLPR